jgi:hypothetical protein
MKYTETLFGYLHKVDHIFDSVATLDNLRQIKPDPWFETTAAERGDRVVGAP